MHDVTAYCITGTMASGEQTRHGAIATLSRRIAFGTRLLIAGRIYTVLDRIGHSSDFDIWMDDCDDADAWGRQRLEVVVLP
jgi:3D (Asp-Asp-Asp) domain-containing protein